MDARVKPAVKSRRIATYRDVLDAPPGMVAEVLAGVLHTQPRPAPRHAWASSRLGGRLDGPFNPGDGPGGWWIVFEPELHLGADIVVPDLGGWRRDTMPDYPDTAYCTVAPDWACEVLSPSTRRIDRHEKSGIYAREGVSHLWFVDPDARTLEAFELREGRWVLLATLADGAPVSLPPFDAVTFPLDALWPDSVSDLDDGEGYARDGSSISSRRNPSGPGTR
ncbi:MAG: Uma2 family endonuclease [Rhodobacter sp.]|nr:Uma2 family endonuclease [Rhodobacter sp.]